MHPWGLALLSGFLIIFCVPNVVWPGFSPWQSAVGWAALIPLFSVLLRPELSPGRAALLTSFTWTIALLGMHTWLLSAPKLAGRAPFFWIGVALLLGMFHSMFGAIAVWGWRRLKARSPWLTILLWWPAVWVALEDFRQRLLGFAWPYAYSQHSWPIVLPFVRLGGTALLSFLLVAWMAGWAYAWHRRVWGPAAGLAGAGLLVIGLGALLHANFEGRLKPSPVDVALLQGARSLEAPRAMEELDVYAEILATLKSPPPTVIAWPEGAVPFYPDRMPVVKEKMLKLIRSTGTYHLVGGYEAVVDPQGHRPEAPPPVSGEGWRPPSDVVSEMNCVWLYDPTGRKLAIYRKRRPFPFGERLPFWPGLFQWASMSYYQLTPGTEPPVFQTPWGTIGTPICNELLMDVEMNQLDQPGMMAIFNPTNDIWMGASAGPAQHLIASIFRAVETGRPIVRVSNSGISAVITPTGKVLASLPYGTKGTLRGRLPQPLEIPWTPWTRRVVMWAVGLTALAGLAFAFSPFRISK